MTNNNSNKNRLLALDGLRGFAALAVVISHLGFNLRILTDSSLILFLFRIISAGSTSVQLFFVLSGFLMALLYPEVKNSISFLEKRYLRIMPIFGVTVVAVWLSNLYGFNRPSLLGIAILLIVSATTHYLWKLINIASKKWIKTGHIIFASFVIFQAFWLIISISTSFGFVTNILNQLNIYQKSFFVMLSNLSMTMYWQKNLFSLEGVFWSLIPEMFFYTIYPFLIIPIVTLSEKLNTKWNFLLVLSIIILLFQLDLGSRSVFFLNGLFISRASGFVIGMCLGKTYRSKTKIWNWLSNQLKKPYINIATLLLFFFTMALEWPDRYHQIRYFVMFHYLGLSILFGIVLAAALIENSLVNRFFQKKVFVFLGTISYSLYLTHSFVIEKISNSSILLRIQDFLSPQSFVIVRGSIILAISILIAHILYQLIESLYFKNKIINKKINSSKQFLIAPILLAVFIIIFYSTDSSPSLLLSRHKIPRQDSTKNISITRNKSKQLQFTANHPYLSVVMLTMDYAYNPNSSEEAKNTQLVFELTKEDGTLITRSTRKPQELEGEPQFPFGFPSQEDSDGKTYNVKLNLENANSSEEVFLYANGGIVTQYTTNQIPFSIKKMFYLISERIIFSLKYSYTLFALGFIFVITIAYKRIISKT